jgi:N-acetylglucosaminyldiphosphoundecaprenol N-acetyl-beta-D-mannosaminyltransferase
LSAPPVRHTVLGAPVDAVTMGEALAYVEARASSPACPAEYVLALNPEKVFALEKDPGLLEFFKGAGLLLPDGIGVVLAMRFLYGAKAGRVPGADLMQAACDLAARRGFGIFLYGATEEVNAGAAAELARRYPGLRVAGRANGYLSPEEREGLVHRINGSGAEILFVALGSPAQERWMRENLPKLEVRVCQGIGGTLDTIVGTVKRAPKIFQRLGLEWFYRLLSQPSRAWRQRVLPVFAIRVLAAKGSRMFGP